MKVIMLTDTHGQIDRINQLAIENNADACIHCGDVGFFDHISIKNMSAAELTKMIRHTSLSQEEKEHLCSLPQTEQSDFVLQNALAGNFEDYLAGRKTFEIPVYAVWGNHEDIRIINLLREKRCIISHCWMKKILFCWKKYDFMGWVVILTKSICPWQENWVSLV